MVWQCLFTIFAVFSLESFAETLVVAVSVQWQTFTFVLTRPTATRCLSKECIMIIHMQFYIRHLEIDVYRGPQTSTGRVSRLQLRVYGRFSTFSTARGRFSRKSFTSTLSLLVWMFCDPTYAWHWHTEKTFLFHFIWILILTRPQFCFYKVWPTSAAQRWNPIWRHIILYYIILYYHAILNTQRRHTANLKPRFAVRGKRRS